MQKLAEKERGQGLVEYALLLVLVAVVVVGILTLLGPQIGNVFSRVNHSLGMAEGTAVEDDPGGNVSPPTVLRASAFTDGSGTVIVDVSLSHSGNIIIRDQASGISVSGLCNTPCRSELHGLAESGVIDVIGANVVSAHYDDN